MALWCIVLCNTVAHCAILCGGWAESCLEGPPGRAASCCRPLTSACSAATPTRSLTRSTPRTMWVLRDVELPVAAVTGNFDVNVSVNAKLGQFSCNTARLEIDTPSQIQDSTSAWFLAQRLGDACLSASAATRTAVATNLLQCALCRLVREPARLVSAKALSST